MAQAAGQSGNDGAPANAAQETPSLAAPVSAPSAQSQNSGANDISRAPVASQASGAEPALSQAASNPANDANGSAAQEQNSPSKAVGTAAAPTPEVAGVAGSRLTGAVIAPAKQRRVRTFLIRIGVVVGACVAIGTVAALSHSSSSQPRMSH
jgi:hypothetical protein